MFSVEPPHIVMEILGSEMGSLPIPKPRRNTSLPNLEIAKELTKSCHDGNMKETCCRRVSFMTTICQLFVSVMATL